MSVTSKVLGRHAIGNTGSKARPAFENYEDGIDPEDMALAQQLEIDQTQAMEESELLEHEILEDGEEAAILGEAVNTYPAVVEMLEQDINDNGGVSVESAKYLNVILQTAGLGGIVNVSVESFGDNKARLGQSRVALEGLKETLRNWWENLLNMFKKMREKIKKWWTKNFSTAAAVKSRAAALAERAKKISNSNPKEKKLTFPRIQSTLQVGDRFQSSSLKAGMQAIAGVGTSLYNDWQGKGIETAEKVLDVIDNAELSGAGVAALGSAFVAAVASHAKPDTSAFKAPQSTAPDAYTNVNAEFQVLATSELPGQKALYLKERKNSPSGEGLAGLQNAVSWLTSRSFRIDDARKKSKEDTDTSVDVLNTTDIADICTVIEDHAALVEGYQRNFKNQEKANDDIDKFRKLADQNIEENDADAIKAQNELKKVPNALKDMINEPVNQFTAYFFRTANAAMQLCERSLSQY